ncbi:hypothetical protein HY772_02410 [Candidatus Woesearchaeota archaeon]|nr:hypothetical protein [Candidatus Woesearchaeota archaeon]
MVVKEETTTIYFVGAHYELTGSQVTKYYFAGASRIAMQKYTVPQSMTVEYFLGDHLGSTSLTTDTNRAKVSELRYKPCPLRYTSGGLREGEVRYAWTASLSTSPAYELTKYTYTGQYSHMDDPATSGVEGFGLMDYNARWYDPSLGRFAQADTIVPTFTQGVQAWDRYAYVSNNPVRYNDPTGHCTMCIGAVVGGLVNAGLYIYTESRQPGGFDLQSDWKDLTVAIGTGAIAGALIGSGVGASAGAAMFASAAGVGMAGNIVSDHAENFLTGEDFSAEEHMITSATGAAQGLVAGQLTTVTTGAAGIGAQLLNAGMWGGLDETLQSGMEGSATLEDFGNGFISSATSEAFALGMMKIVRWDADSGVWIEPPKGVDDLFGVTMPAHGTFWNWAVREEQKKWKNGYYDAK